MKTSLTIIYSSGLIGEKIIVRELLELMGAKTESGGNIGLSGEMRIKRERECFYW